MSEALFNPAIFVFFIPITAIVGGMALGAFKEWIKHQERKLEINSQRQGSSVDDSVISSLKNEIMQVRSVSNEYDMSIQHTLEQIQMRLERLENQRSTVEPYSSKTPSAPDASQSVIVGQQIK